jgi:hypothetical protein
MEYSEFPLGIAHPENVILQTANTLDELFAKLSATAANAAWSPATFDPPRRAAKNVRFVHALVLDVDGKHGPAGTLDEARSALTGMRFAMHTTRSHKDDAHSFRVVIALCRAVRASEFQTIWHRVADVLLAGGVTVDRSTKDASRGWFVPPRDSKIIFCDGEPVDVDHTLKSAPTRSVAADRAAKRISSAREGERNSALFNETRRLRSRVHAGEISEADLRTRLTAAARSSGLPDAEIEATIRSALQDPEPPPGRPRIMTSGGDYWRVIDDVCEALSEIENFYQRGRVLVQLTSRDPTSGAIAIQQVGPQSLRYELTRRREFAARTTSGVRPVWPGDSVLAGALDKGNYPGVRPLVGVSESPTIDSNGRVLAETGYDERTQLFVSADDVEIFVGQEPSQEQACAAFQILAKLFSDFPFADSAKDLSVVIAALLSLVGRPAFEGSSPVFAVSANVRGSGKTLLTELLTIIAMGRAVPMTPVPANNEECTKIIGALLLDGSRLLILDNAAAEIRLPTLDSLITSSTFRVRELGSSRMIEGPNRLQILINGNCLQLQGDLSRRTIPIELETREEAPEKRSGFKHADIKKHALKNRGAFLSAALTILRAHAVAGWPADGVAVLGSFEGWSRRIGAAIVFAGGVDPVLARARRASVADRDAETLGRFLEAFEIHHPDGATVRKVVEQSYPSNGCKDPRREDLRDVMEEIAPPQGTAMPDVRRLGRFVANHERRVVESRRFISNGKGHAGLRKWRVEHVGESETNGTDSPTHPDGVLVGTKFNQVLRETTGGDQ